MLPKSRKYLVFQVQQEHKIWLLLTIQLRVVEQFPVELLSLQHLRCLQTLSNF